MISKGAFIKVFLGSFFIQGSWSFEKMQGLGFAAAISPALSEIYAEDGARNAALKRHLAYYNAHPYMASPVLGACIAAEEKAAKGAAAASESVEFKARVMGAYGALGDSFFWGSIRPMASCIGVLASLVWGLKGPVVFLVVYNIFHLWMRWRGLKDGLELGAGVVRRIKALDLPGLGLKAKRAGCAALGCATALSAYGMLSLSGAGGLKAGVIAVTIAIAAAAYAVCLVLKRGVTIERLVYMTAAPLAVYGIIIWQWK